MKLIHFVLVVLFFVSCENTSNKRDFTRYYNDDLNISVKKIKDWETKENFQGVPVFFMSPPESEEDSFRENITILSEDAPDYSLNKYYQHNIEGINQYLPDFKTIEEPVDIKINGHVFKKITYTYNSQNSTLQTLIYLTIKDKKGYIINCSALNNTFNNHEKQFKGLAESFKFE